MDIKKIHSALGNKIAYPGLKRGGRDTHRISPKKTPKDPKRAQKDPKRAGGQNTPKKAQKRPKKAKKGPKRA